MGKAPFRDMSGFIGQRWFLRAGRSFVPELRGGAGREAAHHGAHDGWIDRQGQVSHVLGLIVSHEEIRMIEPGAALGYDPRVQLTPHSDESSTTLATLRTSPVSAVRTL